MNIELKPLDLIKTFMSELPNMPSVPQEDFTYIRKNLNVLANIRRAQPYKYSRSSKTKAAIKLWKYLFDKALSSVTSNLRGCSDLLDYFDQYVHYENVLFAVDKNHRDHVIHCIWVMLIGIHLRRKCKPLKELTHAFILQFTDDERQSTLYKDLAKSVQQKELVIWLLIALTHDLGYPIQKTMIANQEMVEMIKNFGFLELSPFSYQFTTVHQPSIDALLDTLSTTIVCRKAEGIESYHEGKNMGVRLDYAKSFERLDHGIMSAYLIQKNLDFICDTYPEYQGIPNPELHWAGLDTYTTRTIIVMWLESISDHTSKFIYGNRLDSLSTLLFLCDELDEFSRYSHKPNSDEWSSIICETKLNCTTKSLDFSYRFTKETDFDYLSFFKRKVNKVMNRFELSSKGVQKTTIACIVDWKSEKTKYCYENRHNARAFIRRSHKGITYDIAGFLKGTVTL